MASAEDTSESLKCKTWMLRVSIHCEGCRKKVLKILKRIPGVYDTEIDSRHNKVTVKTIVDAETLIRRLEKSGKHAELWPEKQQIKHNAANGDTGNKQEKKENSTPNKPSENSERKPVADADKKAEVESKDKSQAKPPSKANHKTDETATAQQSQPSESKKINVSTKKSGKPAAGTNDGNEKEGLNNGGGKKKGKKNAQKESSDVDTQKNSEADARKNFESRRINSPQQQPQPMYSSPQYPTPPPAYVMSYNMAQPSVSQAYYAAPPVASSQGYSYMPYPPQYHASSDYSSAAWTQPPPPPHDNMFSDENPNACNLM